MSRRTMVEGTAVNISYWYEQQYPNEVQGKPAVSARSKQFMLVREVFDSSPLPALPRFNTESNAEHVANGIALFQTALYRLFG